MDWRTRYSMTRERGRSKSNLYIYPKFTNRPLRGKPKADRGKRALAHILDRGPDLRCGYNACRQLRVWTSYALWPAFMLLAILFRESS